jgi:transposase InsO family protein
MIGPLPTASGGFNRVLVAIDKFTKWIEVKPVTCPKADRVLDFLDELVHRYGLPHRIITDLGSNFNNHQFWEYCENSGIDVRYVSVPHPRANGQVERANGMVLDTLKKRLHDAANIKRRKVDQGTTQHTLGAAYSTHQADRTVTIFPGLQLRSYPTCRRHVGFAGSRAIRRGHI